LAAVDRSPDYAAIANGPTDVAVKEENVVEIRVRG
jgi:hypothetical protein